jgi:hypothetical protein
LKTEGAISRLLLSLCSSIYLEIIVHFGFARLAEKETRAQISAIKEKRKDNKIRMPLMGVVVPVLELKCLRILWS